MFVFGGRNGLGASNVLQDLWKYTYATATWTQIATVSVAVACFCFCFFLGGLVFGFASAKYALLSNIQTPIRGTFGHTAVFDPSSSSMYVYGGDAVSFAFTTRLWYSPDIYMVSLRPIFFNFIFLLNILCRALVCSPINSSASTPPQIHGPSSLVVAQMLSHAPLHHPTLLLACVRQMPCITVRIPPTVTSTSLVVMSRSIIRIPLKS
jgi:hypothetical protein